MLRDGEVTLVADAPTATDTSLALRTAAASAELDKPMARSTLDRLAAEAVAPEGVWPPETLHALLRLLGAGQPAVAAIESLDQLGIWLRYLPEWAPIRNKPQRNAYHRFTVDRHLLETAARAAALTRTVARPDLLLLGALFHDIGKGRSRRSHRRRHRPWCGSWRPASACPPPMPPPWRRWSAITCCCPRSPPGATSTTPRPPPGWPPPSAIGTPWTCWPP